MKRAQALERLDIALGDGIERMFTILEASFVSDRITNEDAKKHFEFGVDCQLEDHAYAVEIITAKFRE